MASASEAPARSIKVVSGVPASIARLSAVRIWSAVRIGRLIAAP
jgi:hypothetical protein